DGNHTIADKVIKLPSKRILNAFRTIFDDYETHAYDDEYFNNYYARQGKRYFYSLLKSLGDITTIEDSEYVDWGHNEDFVPEIGTGECAGVSLDVVGTIILDAEEKLHYAKEALDNGSYTDSVYNSYHAIIVGAKALLLNDDISCNTQIGIIKDFDEYFVTSSKIGIDGSFEDFVLKINKNKPEEPFVSKYYEEASAFIELVKQYRAAQKSEDKLVITDFYKA
ncbi:MAG: HEPN domain-containing protein, partial [Fulvivirga sp.]